MAVKMLDARQEAKLNMYQVVQGYCGDNSSVVETNIGFKNAVAEFGAVAAQIDSGAQLVSANLTGIAIDKNVSKKDLSREAATMAGRIYAFASKNGDNTMKQQADSAESDFLRLKDAELAPACQATHDLANANKVALKDYGVTVEKLAALQTKIDAYAAAVPKPRSAIAGRKTTKANIKQLFKQADAVLIDQMDRLVNDFEADHPAFVAGYFNARIIVDPKSKPKENGENGEGDENAKGEEAGDGDGNGGNGEGAENPPA